MSPFGRDFLDIVKVSRAGGLYFPLPVWDSRDPGLLTRFRAWRDKIEEMSA